MGRDYSGLYVSSVQMLFGMGGASRYPIPSHTESTLRQKHITSELTERLTKQRIEFAILTTIGWTIVLHLSKFFIVQHRER